MKLNRLTHPYAVALVLLGIAGFGLTGGESVTALIPAAFGVVVFALSLLASRRPWANLAVFGVVALGLAGTFSGLLGLGAVLEGTAERPAAAISQATMFALSVTYIALALASRRAVPVRVEADPRASRG